MCFGRYDPETNKPLMAGTVMVPRVDIGQQIEFIIDTGADGTVIGGPDAIHMGLTPSEVGDDVDFVEDESIGIGGKTKTLTVEEPLMLAFEEYSEKLDKYSLHIEFTSKIEIVPACSMSLLGRDILDRFDVEFRQSQGEVELVRHNYGEGAYLCMALDEEFSPSLISPEEEG